MKTTMKKALQRCYRCCFESLALCVALAATPALAETVCFFSGGTRSGGTYTIGPRIDTGKKYDLPNSLSMSAWVRVSPNITTVKPVGPGQTQYYGAAIAGQGFYGGERGFGFLTGGFNSADKSDDNVGYQVRIPSGSPNTVSDSYKTNTLFTADEWHHYLVVRDKTDGRVRFYVDGELFSEKDCPDWTLTPSRNFAIAYNPVGNGGSFCGYIADIALWNVALSAGDAARLPRVGPENVSTAPIAYFPLNEGSGNTVNETVNSTSHTSTGGDLEWVDDPDFIRSCVGHLEVTASLDGISSPSPDYGVTNGLAAGDSFTVSCGATPLANTEGSIQYSCSGWKLYDETNVVVETGTGTSFTYVHPTPAAYRRLEWQWTISQNAPGRIVCYFSGGTRSGSTYTIGPRIDTEKKYDLPNSLSMSAWVRVSPNITTVKPVGPHQTEYYAAAIAGQGFYGEDKGFGFFTSGFNTLATSDDTLGYQVRIKSPSTQVNGSYKDATLFTADKWHHYLLVRDQAAGKSRFYVDGELLSETNCPSEWNLTPSQNFAIAYNSNGNGGSFCGYIADLALWDVALSAEDAECLPRRGPKRVSTAPIAYFPLDEGWGDGVKEFCGSITNYHSATGTLEWKVVPDFVSKLGMIIIVR